MVTSNEIFELMMAVLANPNGPNELDVLDKLNNISVSLGGIRYATIESAVEAITKKLETQS